MLDKIISNDIGLNATLADLLEGVNHICCAFDREWRITYINTATEDYFQQKRADVLGRVIWEAVPAFIGTHIEERLRRVMETGVPEEFEAPSILYQNRWIEARFFPTRDGIAGSFRDITTTRMEQEILRASEARVRRVTDAIPVLVAYIDQNQCYNFVNRQYEKRFNRPRSDIEGKHLSEVLGDEAYEVIRPYVETALSGQSISHRTQVPYRDLGMRYIEGECIPDIAPNGRILGCYTSVTDVTERTLAEEALRESEARARSLSHLVPTIVWFANPAGEMLFLNDRWYEYSGFAEEASLGHGWAHCMHPDDLQRILQMWAEVLGHGIPHDAEFRLRRHDGEYRWHLARADPMRDEQGRITGWFGTTTDVHDLKMAEAVLQDREERLLLALQAGQLGSWELELETGTLSASETMKQHFGFAPDALFSVEIMLSATHPDDRSRVYDAMQRSLNAEMDYDNEYRVVWPTGDVRWIQVQGRVHSDADGGKSRRLIGVSLDVTARKHGEEQQKLLINELNHRVKNTFATVQSIALMTAKNTNSVEAFNDAFLARLLALSDTHNLLTRGMWESALLRDVLMKELSPFQERSADRLTVKGVAVQLSAKMTLLFGLVFHELTTNAIKHGALSRPEGHIDINWNVRNLEENRWLSLEWKESGGPVVNPPSRVGFGSTLIERGIKDDLNGKIENDYAPSGLRCVIEVPLPIIKR